MLPTAWWVLPRRRRLRAWSKARSPSVQPPCSSVFSHAGMRQAGDCSCAHRRQGCRGERQQGSGEGWRPPVRRSVPW